MGKHFTIGRKRDNDFVLSNAFISGTHATMWREAATGRVVVEDSQSANHLFVNTPEHPVESSYVNTNDIYYFSRHHRVPGNVLLQRFEEWEQGLAAPELERSWGGVERVRKGVVGIGSAPDNDVVLPFLSVMDVHAQLLQGKDGKRYLRGMGGVSYVNGIGYSSETVELSPQDDLEIGGVTISLEFTQRDPKSLVIGYEREGIFLESDKLSFIVKDRKTGDPKTILNEIGLAVFPGEFVGLLGPSGCGKTTLLNMLSGSVAASEGDVLFNGVSLGKNRSRFANQIGYVPQDDIMHAELTVREVLYYSARLRLPSSTSDTAINAKIDELCKDLGLYKPGTELDLRDTVIGSPQNKTLSGGQKKRVNLAIELLTDPRVLFLDEPTSGLSSMDTRIVMENLRRLSRDKGIAIIITIHQPAPRIYGLFDEVIYLKTGRLSYFGPAVPDSVNYFNPKNNPEINGPDGVMEVIDGNDERDMEEEFRRSTYYTDFVLNRKERLAADTRKVDTSRVMSEGPSAMNQFIKLTSRYFRCKLRDKMSMVILLIQAPLVAGLLYLAFDEKGMNAPLFLMGFVAIWFGTNNSARELVGERDIFMRESRSGLAPGSYLASKAVLQGLFVGFQCSVLFLLTDLALNFDVNSWLAIGVCVLCGMVGVSIGLLVSALSKTEVTAIVSIPLILIPFILLGGFITPYDDLPDETRIAVNLMPTRWSYEAMIQGEQLKHSTRDSENEERVVLNDQGKPRTDEFGTIIKARVPTKFKFQEFSREIMFDDLKEERILQKGASEDSSRDIKVKDLVISGKRKVLDRARYRRIFFCFCLLLPYILVPLAGTYWRLRRG